MHTEPYLQTIRPRFTSLRWLSFMAALVILFSFGQGLMPARLWLGALLLAPVHLSCLVLGCRLRNDLLHGVGFLAVIAGARITGVHAEGVTMVYFTQWICVLLILAGLPLTLFRKPLQKIAKCQWTAE